MRTLELGLYDVLCPQRLELEDILVFVFRVFNPDCEYMRTVLPFHNLFQNPRMFLTGRFTMPRRRVRRRNTARPHLGRSLLF